MHIADAGYREKLFALLVAGSSEEAIGCSYDPNLDIVFIGGELFKVCYEASETTTKLIQSGYDEPSIDFALSRLSIIR